METSTRCGCDPHEGHAPHETSIRHDDAKELMLAYVDERGRGIRTRLHALWLLRRGTPLPAVARTRGTGVPSVQRWLD